MSLHKRLAFHNSFKLAPILVACMLASVWAQIRVQGGTSSSVPSAAPTQYPGQVRVDFYMTPQEAAHLLGAVDEIIAFDSKVTGLVARDRVGRQITDRNQLKQLADKKLKDTDISQRLRQSSLILQKLGFIPRDFDLQKFALESSLDELAGYYDPHVKTMYLLNWLPVKLQEPVMAHELDHALQDQNFGLEKWIKIQDAPDKRLSEAELDEERAARRAVAEGHATAVMIDYALAPYGKSLAQLPVLSPDLFQKTAERYSRSAAMQSAPLLLREATMFPYTYGLTFIHQVLLKAGKQQAYSGVFKNPPRSTREIMEPDMYLSRENLRSLNVPALDSVLGSDYPKLADGIMGEFDSMVFLRQFGSPDQARRITPQWRGGYYFAARRPADSAKATPQDREAEPKPGETKPPDPSRQLPPIKLENIALLYISRWATPAAAHDFAEVYRASIPVKYPGAQSVIAMDQPNLKEEFAHWDTFEGSVVIQVREDQVLALEGFDSAILPRLQSALLNKPKAQPTKGAGTKR